MKTYKLNKQHEKFMLNAGFISDNSWNKDNSFNIHYWKRGDINLIFTKNKPITMNIFVGNLIRHTEYKTKRNLLTSFKPLKTQNENESRNLS